jgi:hypothetical protein
VPASLGTAATVGAGEGRVALTVSPAAKLCGFLLLLAVIFIGAYVAGAHLGPVSVSSTTPGHSGPGGSGGTGGGTGGSGGGLGGSGGGTGGSGGGTGGSGGGTGGSGGSMNMGGP